MIILLLISTRKNLYNQNSGLTAKEISQQLDEMKEIYNTFIDFEKSEHKKRKSHIPPRYPKPSKAALDKAKLAVEHASLKLAS
jgi:hypothetical protein